MPNLPQGYALGWLFVLMEASTAVRSGSTWLSRGLAFALALAAISCRSWGWYLLIVVIPLAVALGLGRTLINWASPDHPVQVVALLLAGVAIQLAWWVYFYRRRAMFDASHRWRWLEHRYPSIAGPEVSARPVVSLRWLYSWLYLFYREWRSKSWRHLSRLSTYLIALSCPPAVFVRRREWVALSLVGIVWIVGAGFMGLGIVLLCQVALTMIPLTSGIVLALYLGLFFWLLSTALALVLWPAGGN